MGSGDVAGGGGAGEVPNWPVLPMKAVSGKLPVGPAWRYEPKWDGHRALVLVGDGAFEAISSTGQPRTAVWSWLADALATLPARAVIDGEVIAFGDDGQHEFQLVGRHDREHAFVVFDVLSIERTDLTGLPWERRRHELEQLVMQCPQLIVTPVSTDAEALVETTLRAGFEGVMAKRADSRYLPGRRSATWVKHKHGHGQEFVVGGYLPGAGRRRTSFGSLVLGVHGDRGLQYVGAVGSGFSDAVLTELSSELHRLRRDQPPFADVPRQVARSAVWVEPVLVVQVVFNGWTADDKLRQPVFAGRRDDVDPARVIREPRDP